MMSLPSLVGGPLETMGGRETASEIENHSCQGGDNPPSSSDSLFSEAQDEPAKKHQSLSHQIFVHLERSAYDDRDFLPEGWIDELVTEESVREELKCPADKQKHLELAIKFIFTKEDGAKKLFVITLLCGIPKDDLKLVKAMLRFRRAEITDSCLPIKLDECSAFIDEKGGFYSPWNSVMVRNFGENQWAVLAPVFTDKNTKLTLEPGYILPIVGNIKGGETGAFGEVVQVTIHERHWFNPILKVSLRPRCGSGRN